MTFVNYLAGVSQIPAWAKHMPDKADGYTFVDLVFPAFLFAAGMSIPLALGKRLTPGLLPWQALGRVFTRSAALIFVGVLMVNTENYDSAHAVLGKNWWYLLAYLCVIAIWCQPPPRTARTRRIWGIGRWTGIAVMFGLLCLFRGKGADGQVVWLQHSWWGILGLIGWAYLVCSLLYLSTKGDKTWLMGWLGFLLCLYVGGRHGSLDWLGPVNRLVDAGSVLGSTAASMLIGMIVTLSLGDTRSRTKPQQFRSLLLFGVILYAAGLLVRPLHGINKNAATESYALVAGGICCLCFAVIWLLYERPQPARCGACLTTAGQNAVLAYILPGILGNLCAVIGLPGLLHPWSIGWAGAMNSALLTALVIALTCGASRFGIRLRL